MIIIYEKILAQFLQLHSADRQAWLICSDQKLHELLWVQEYVVVKPDHSRVDLEEVVIFRVSSKEISNTDHCTAKRTSVLHTAHVLLLARTHAPYITHITYTYTHTHVSDACRPVKTFVAIVKWKQIIQNCTQWTKGYKVIILEYV